MMEKWFGKETIASFTAFGMPHILIMSVYIIGILVLLIYSKKVSTNKSISKAIGYTLLSILFISELSYQTWGVINHFWNPREFLPFQLCSIAGIIAILALITYHHKLTLILFFIGIVPSLLALITPELHHGYPHFRFWQLFIHHIALSWASFFLIIRNPIRVTLKNTFEVYLYLLAYAGFIGFIVNPLLNANFLFLAGTSSSNTLLNLLGSDIWYYINLCLIGLISFLLLFIVHKALNYNKAF
jgi:hypothetical integral membrane protein (TIGR02206 family)